MSRPAARSILTSSGQAGGRQRAPERSVAVLNSKGRPGVQGGEDSGPFLVLEAAGHSVQYEAVRIEEVAAASPDMGAMWRFLSQTGTSP
jgi:hypothetical protein